MKEVFQLDKTAVGDKAVVYLGGEDADNNWPINPMGENLKLIMTFKNNSINKILGEPLLPDGKYTSVFQVTMKIDIFWMTLFILVIKLNLIISGRVLHK